MSKLTGELGQAAMMDITTLKNILLPLIQTNEHPCDAASRLADECGELSRALSTGKIKGRELIAEARERLAEIALEAGALDLEACNCRECREK